METSGALLLELLWLRQNFAYDKNFVAKNTCVCLYHAIFGRPVGKMVRPVPIYPVLSCLWHSSIVAKRLDGSIGMGSGNPAPLNASQHPHFSAHVCCGQMTG